MLDWLANPEVWIALGTLTALEIVLGIDNIIFLSVLVGRLPESQRAVARRVGLGLAMMARLGLLFSISFVMGLTKPWVTILGHGISGRDLILVGGGLFLMAKATHEIHNSLEGVEEGHTPTAAASLGMVLLQIALLDIVFSLDSVITAVGLVEHVSIMAVAIILAVVVIVGIAAAIWNSPGLDEYTKGIATLILGRFLGYLDNIYNFEFGSTRSSKQKDASIENLTAKEKE